MLMNLATMKIYLAHNTIKILYRKIGVVNTIRFINQFTTGHGNYTEEREQLFGDLSLDEIMSEIKLMRKQTA